MLKLSITIKWYFDKRKGVFMGMKHVCCPRCGSFGLSQSLNAKGEIEYKCHNCRSRFGDEAEAKEYADLFTRFLIEIKDILGNRMILKLSKSVEDSKYYLKLGRSKEYEGILDVDFWEELSDKMFMECYFHKWNETYFSTKDNCGVVWDMEASFSRRHTLSVHGCNSFPVHWKNIVSLFLPILEKYEGQDTFVHALIQE